MFGRNSLAAKVHYDLDLSYNRLPLTDDFLAIMAAWYDKQNQSSHLLCRERNGNKIFQADDLKKLNSFLKKPRQ